ncbi:MAG: CaiB/BaiF CoA-transferase family protein [Polyangiales bacterium]
MNKKPLEGVSVLDLSRLLPGPYASMVLCDLGARVDKVEDPGGGDYARVTPPFADDGMGFMYHWCNRGKRSLILDLKTEAGRKALYRMLPNYDIVLEGNRPGVMKRLGLDYDSMRKVHPKVIYCSISGYGQDGPLEQKAGHDLNYIARGGVLSFTGPADGKPQMPGVQIGDIGGALFGVIGILAALHGRDAKGEGQYIDISMTEAALSLSVVGLSSHIGGWSLGRGKDVLMGGIAIYNTYRTKDGAYVTLGALEPKFWKAFCDGVGIEADMNALMPGPHQETIKAKVADVFAQRTAAEWKTFSGEVDCCMEVIPTADEVVADPHHNARKVWSDSKTHKGTPLKFARTPVATAAEGVAPKHGQNTDEILKGNGFSETEISEMKQNGVVR